MSFWVDVWRRSAEGTLSLRSSYEGKVETPKVDLVAVLSESMKLPKENVAVLAVMTALVAIKVLSGPSKAPAWVEGLPRVSERHAGPWRGKGSFGRGFGSQAKHR